MKAHQQRDTRVQGKQFRGIAKTATPLSLPKVTACCTESLKYIETLPLTSCKCIDYYVLLHSFYACPSSLSAPYPWQSDRNCLFLHTSFPCAVYSHQERLWQAGPAPWYEESTEETQGLCFYRHLQRGSHAKELKGQAGWGTQDLSQNKCSVPSNAELLPTP